MAKSVAQAEAELRTAALDYAEADAIYAEAFHRNGDMKRYEGLPEGQEPAPLHPETQAKVRVASEKSSLLTKAAHALRDAVRAELRAEAL